MTTQELHGCGVGLRHVHYSEILENGACGAAWFETVSENHFEPGGRPWSVLSRVRRDVPVALHGVGLGIGNTDPISDDYLRALSTVIERVEPARVTDHLCWTASRGRYAHDLLPLPCSEDVLAHLVARVHHVQERIGCAMSFENPSAYLFVTGSTMPEWELLNRLCRATGARILLDVNNVVVTAKNGGPDPATYVDGIDFAHVDQIHLAGHTDYGDHVIDTHVGPVPDDVWTIYRRAIARAGRPIATLIEWDEAIPPLDRVVAEAGRADAIAREVLGHA